MVIPPLGARRRAFIAADFAFDAAAAALSAFAVLAAASAMD